MPNGNGFPGFSKFQAPNNKYQTNPNDLNSKSQPFGSSVLVIGGCGYMLVR